MFYVVTANWVNTTHDTLDGALEMVRQTIINFPNITVTIKTETLPEGFND